MATPFDTFLPSGAIEEAPCSPFFGSPASISPLAFPPRGSLPNIPSHVPRGRSTSPKLYSGDSPALRSPHQHHDKINISHSSLVSPQHQNSRPQSPRFSRVSTEDDSHAAHIQSWRIYTQHLRENAQGERAHMEADRARMEEVMAEERALWDQERDFLTRRIEELESRIATLSGRQNLQQGPTDPGMSVAYSHGSQKDHQRPPRHAKMATSGAADSSGNPAKLIRQESGRNPDGSPFYAPAPRNPSRTFESSLNSDLRVDNMPMSRESPIRITSKELSESDFRPRPPSAGASRRGGSESIDISHLQPELEGVPLKVSAFSPAFVAEIRSSNSSSPTKASSYMKPPPQRHDMVMTQNGLTNTSTQNKKTTLEVIAAPETYRLTLNAGHTPNHSIHKLDFGDSGGVTPIQSQDRHHNPAIASGETVQPVDENIDPDPELRGPLGLKNDPPKDELFLTALTNKLREVKESGLMSSGEISLDNEDQNAMMKPKAANVLPENKGPASVSEGLEDDGSMATVDETLVIKVKASMNFGRPFGSL